MKHSKLAPSSASRRAVCPGSRELEEQYPETGPSLSSIEGTTAHWVAAEYLAGRYDVPACDPTGEPITKEMLDGADLYEHAIGWKDGLHIEERVDISVVHPECWGTPDCWAVVDDRLYLYDYKFGHGYVEIFENWQLLEYAAGIYQLHPEVNTVSMTIVQPRCYTSEGTVRHWTITADQLRAYISQMQAFESAAMKEDPECIPSSECTHCTARHACEALQKTVGRILDVVKSQRSHELSSLQTGSELRDLKQAAVLLDARMTGLEEQAKAMITRGEYVPGFKMQPGQSREHWLSTPKEIITLGDLMGVALAKPVDVITPSQARKAGIPEDIILTYSRRVSGKLKLVEVSDARKVFTQG